MTDKELGAKLLAYMVAKKYPVYALNVIALEDCDFHGNPIKGQLDHWDDLIFIVKNTGEIVFKSRGTTEPGGHYTYNPMNPNGAARIALGHHEGVWAFGDHRGQKALVQVKPVRVHRDKNKDGSRAGDAVFTDLIGLNWHTVGLNKSASVPAKIGRWSAGCIVIQSANDFYTKFTPLLRSSGRKSFDLTVIGADSLAKL